METPHSPPPTPAAPPCYPPRVPPHGCVPYPALPCPALPGGRRYLGAPPGRGRHPRGAPHSPQAGSARAQREMAAAPALGERLETPPQCWPAPSRPINGPGVPPSWLLGWLRGGPARLGAGGRVPLRHPWPVPLGGLRHRLPGTRGLGSFRFLFMNVSSGSLIFFFFWFLLFDYYQFLKS